MRKLLLIIAAAGALAAAGCGGGVKGPCLVTDGERMCGSSAVEFCTGYAEIGGGRLAETCDRVLAEA